MDAFVERKFRVRARGSTIATEIRAGLTTFMTIAYILVVNPTVLSGAGLPFGAVAFATAMTAIVGCTIAGIFGNLPFGLAPGMGLNAYFAFGVCIAKGLPAGVALTIVFLMGATFALLAATGACSLLQKIMPDNLKHATTVAIGIFQAFIGFRMVDIVVSDPHTLVALGDVTSSTVLLSVGTIIVIGVLIVHRVPGAMLLGIGASSVFSWVAGLQPLPTHVVELPTMRSMWSELRWEETLSRWEETVPVLLAFLFVCIFDTAGVQFGAGMQAGLIDSKTGELPGTKAAFLASATATLVGGVLGTSPTIIHNETCAGIARAATGLVALVVAFMFALSVFFVPYSPLYLSRPRRTHHRWGIHDGPRWCHGLGQLQGELASVLRCGHAAHLFHRQRRHCQPALVRRARGLRDRCRVGSAAGLRRGSHRPLRRRGRQETRAAGAASCLLAGRLLQRSQRPHACAQLRQPVRRVCSRKPTFDGTEPSHAAEQFWQLQWSEFVRHAALAAVAAVAASHVLGAA